MSPNASSSLTIVDRTATLAQRRPMAPADVVRAFFARRSPKTVEAYRGDLHLLAAWLGLPRPDDLNALAVHLFAQNPGTLNALLMEWVQEQTNEGKAPFTVNRRLSAVRSFIKMGRTLGLINWALDVQGVRGASGVRDMRGPVPADIKKLFAVAGLYETALLHLLYTRGLRRIEVCELQVKHILSDRSEVLIRGKGKTGLTPVTVGPRTLDALRTITVGFRKQDAFVFALRGNQKPSPGSIWNVVQRLGKRAGVKVRPHGLRHSAITAVLDATNGDIRRTQKFSRHQNPAVLLHHYDDARTDFGGELTRELEKP